MPTYDGSLLTGSKTIRVEPELKGFFYYFTLTGVNAVQMGDEIQAALYMSKDGAPYCSAPDTYSVATYAYTQLAKTDIRWVIPHFLLDTARSCGIREENIIPAYPGTPITAGPLHILPFEGKHYRPGTHNGLDELGYHISADNAPTLVFPVDTRDYAADNLPDMPPADVCFANVWLGDSNGFAEDYTDIGARFADFMLHFSDRQILFSHLYETGREDRDMWRREHADILSAIIKEKSPKTSTVAPVLGEIVKL